MIYSIIVILIPVISIATGNLNAVADNLLSHLGSVYTLIGMANYVAGFCFLCVSVFKFKQHKDNPTQQTIGNPLMYLLLAILLMYMANIIKPIGDSLFNSGDVIFGKIS